jgi:hypothetical protein
MGGGFLIYIKIFCVVLYINMIQFDYVRFLKLVGQ